MRYPKLFARWSAVAIGLVALMLFGRPAQAEWYVAGQGGVSFSNSFNNAESTGAFAGIHFSDLDLHRAPVYGAKVGYYFDSLKWLGVEMEAFSSTPHLKQQNTTLSFGGASASTILPGQDLRVTNWAPINVVVRYQMGPIEPYGGVGLGVFFARIHDGATNTSASSNARPGLNTQVGIRWRITNHLSLFGEWKYNRATFHFQDPAPGTVGLRGDYSAHIGVGGLAWHF